MANMNVLLPDETVVTAEVENDFLRDLLTPNGGMGKYAGMEMLDAVDVTSQSLEVLGVEYQVDAERTETVREEANRHIGYSALSQYL